MLLFLSFPYFPICLKHFFGRNLNWTSSNSEADSEDWPETDDKSDDVKSEDELESKSDIFFFNFFFGFGLPTEDDAFEDDDDDSEDLLFLFLISASFLFLEEDFLFDGGENSLSDEYESSI